MNIEIAVGLLIESYKMGQLRIVDLKEAYALDLCPNVVYDSLMRKVKKDKNGC